MCFSATLGTTQVGKKENPGKEATELSPTVTLAQQELFFWFFSAENAANYSESNFQEA